MQQHAYLSERLKHDIYKKTSKINIIQLTLNQAHEYTP